MKRILSFLSVFTLALSLTACSDTKKDSEAETETTTSEETGTEIDYSNQTLTGRVTAIDGTTVTLQPEEFNAPDTSNDGAGQQNGQPPEIPDGADGGQAPSEIPDGADGGQAPSEMPDGADGGQAPSEIPDGADGGQPPSEMPDGADGGQAPSEMPDGADGSPNMSGFMSDAETAVLDISTATIQIETDAAVTEGSISDISVGSILIVEVGENNTVTSVTIKSTDTNGQMGGSGFGGSGEVTQGTSANIIDTDGEYAGEAYTSTGDDENALRIDGASVTLSGITVDKSAGATSNTEDGDFYGMNAALLATNGANVTITDITVTSSAQNGNGIFCYGSGTTVTVSDSDITTTADNSGGIQTTGGGTTNASNLTINTSGSSSAAIRSDRGGGTVNVSGGSYTTTGYNSPSVYSTANITVENAVLTAAGSEALVIEGQNSITLKNCTVSGNMSDTNGSSSDENVHNVMIYQSMSGDAEVGTSEFSMTGGTLTSENGDMFYITNTHCILTLSDVEIVNNETDGYLLNVTGNSASHGWGTAGKNGAQVEFTAKAQSLSGDIVVDTISTLDMTLSDGSNFTGTINIVDNAQNGTAVSDNAAVTVEAGSTWSLTGNCTLTSLTNNGTVVFNGYTITLADGTVLK